MADKRRRTLKVMILVSVFVSVQTRINAHITQ